MMVDLPCVIEAMKSWEKKAWWKSADICQMLLVLGPCNSEEEALNFPLPSAKEGYDVRTSQWAHGVTPPMRWARKRRFRKRVSVKAVEEEEDEVERLLRLDEEAEGSVAREFTEAELERMLEREESSFGGGQEADEDAEGEVDDGLMDAVGDVEGEEEEDMGLADELERAMAADEADGDAILQNQPSSPTVAAATTSSSQMEAEVSTPTSNTAAAAADDDTPTALVSTSTEITSATSATSDSNPDSESDEDEESASGSELVDDSVLARRGEEERKKEQISDLEDAIRATEGKYRETGNLILKGKIGRQLEGLRERVGLLRGGEGEDEEEGEE